MNKFEAKKIIKKKDSEDIYRSEDTLTAEIMRLRKARLQTDYKTTKNLYRKFTNRIVYLKRRGKEKFPEWECPDASRIDEIRPALKEKQTQIRLYVTYKEMLEDGEISEERFEHYIRNLEIPKEVQEFVEREKDPKDPGKVFISKLDALALEELEKYKQTPEYSDKIKSLKERDSDLNILNM